MATGEIEARWRLLVDEYRSRCLWFLRDDYYPATPTERERVLRLIERGGDLAVLPRVAELRAWLSHQSNETSAVS